AAHDVARRDKHAGRAEAALQAVLARKCLAQPEHDRIAVEALDGGNRKPVAGDRERDAGARRLAVDQHRAGAAYAVLTAEVGAGQAALLAQEIGERGPAPAP